MPDVQFRLHEEIKMLRGEVDSESDTDDGREVYLNYLPKAYDDLYLTNYNTHLCQPIFRKFNLADEIMNRFNNMQVEYNVFKSGKGRIINSFVEELKMMNKWAIKEETKINRLENEIFD